MLDEVYEAQRRLNERTVGFDVCRIEDEDTRLAWFRNYLTAWDQELKELLESLDVDAVFLGRFADGFSLDVENVRVEVVDMLHFLVSMFQVVGEPGIEGPGFGDYLADLAGKNDPAVPGDALEMNGLLVRHGLHAVVDTGRILDRVRWKWWARQENRWGEVRADLRGRLLPRWSLLVLASGMDANGVVDLYMRKNKLNFERQDGGYREGTYRKKDDEGREDNLKLFNR